MGRVYGKALSKRVRNHEAYDILLKMFKERDEIRENELLQFMKPGQIKAAINALTYIIPIYEETRNAHELVYKVLKKEDLNDAGISKR